MTLEQRISAFEKLGCLFRETAGAGGSASEKQETEGLAEHIARLKNLAGTVHIYNGWFTKDNVLLAIRSWGQALRKENLEQWVDRYIIREQVPKKIGLIMAGNIPLVGFHDMLCVLISGHSVVAKRSGGDDQLPEFVAAFLISIEPAFKERIHFTDGLLKEMDAVIATGNNNSSRYFDYYFGKYPHIIRKNRNSVAVLNGTETNEELVLLGEDIFNYFGLGCRSVSKLFIPEKYDLNNLFRAVYSHQSVLQNNKYANNYEYTKTVYLMNGISLLENGFLLLKEDIGLASPVAVVYYEYYKNEAEVLNRLRMDAVNIQCVVSKVKSIKNATEFGRTQHPQLWDYSDGVNTMEFLGTLLNA